MSSLLSKSASLECCRIMTKQFDEILLLDGTAVPLLSRPLSGWLQETSCNFDRHRNTALARGYRGTWILHQDNLYLLDIQGHLSSGCPVQMGDLFPHSHGLPVLAQWCSGELRVPRGEPVVNPDASNSVIYPWEIRFTIEEGVVTDRRMVKNEVPKVIKSVVKKRSQWWRRMRKPRVEAV